MRPHILTSQNSLAGIFLAEMRDMSIQRDRMRFRTNMVRLGEIMAYEFSKSLEYEESLVVTPMGQATAIAMTNQLALVSVLRAGQPYAQGFLNYFDRADYGFIGAYRVHQDGGDEFHVNMDYLASNDLTGKELVIIDPMLATGRSLIKSYHALKQNGQPSKIHFMSIIASKEGIDLVKSQVTEPHDIWTVEVDDELNSRGYILPGLGDAGDLAFGHKL